MTPQNRIRPTKPRPEHWRCLQCGFRITHPRGSEAGNCPECLYNRVRIVPLVRVPVLEEREAQPRKGVSRP